MKCAACGYERTFDLDSGEWIGEDEFIDINISTYLFYACPKCKTVIMNDN